MQHQVSSTATRSQSTNLVDAYQKLQQLVDAATPEPAVVVIRDQPSKTSKQIMVEEKRRHSNTKQTRRVDKNDY